MTDPEADRRLYKHARREAFVVVIVWAAALVWVLAWCLLHGYRDKPDEDLDTIAGFPAWVFVGIIIPWLLCSLFTICFGLFWMQDDPLGKEQDEGSGHGH